ncbi:MAG: NAD-dependent epimerase/dehydratase family protein [Deltaproteobacteria bacterium]|jgi:nucleoside-diphosphate-sugar epimerase|nr:NAD-dependent epimerase/dehydratase family protein [Deltaproteobacteria bacterium]
MLVLVTGAGGFLGGRIAELLLQRSYRVRVLVRSDCPRLAALGAEVFQGDLADVSSLDRACDGAEAVIHCAARSGVWGPLAEYVENNTMGTARMLESARQQKAGYFIYTSSPSVVHGGDDLKGIDESAPYTDDTAQPYAYSKMLAERLVLRASHPAFKTLAIRPHLLWGPGDPHLLPRMIERARSGKLRLFTGGPYMVDATYIDNGAEAHILALERLAAGDPVGGLSFFIGQDQPLDLTELVNLLIQTAGLGPVKPSVNKNLGRHLGSILETAYRLLGRKKEPPLTLFTARQLSSSHWYCLDRAKTLLGYRPKVSLDEGLRRLAEYYKNRPAQDGRTDLGLS